MVCFVFVWFGLVAHVSWMAAWMKTTFNICVLIWLVKMYYIYTVDSSAIVYIPLVSNVYFSDCDRWSRSWRLRGRILGFLCNPHLPLMMITILLLLLLIIVIIYLDIAKFIPQQILGKSQDWWREASFSIFSLLAKIAGKHSTILADTISYWKLVFIDY